MSCFSALRPLALLLALAPLLACAGDKEADEDDDDLGGDDWGGDTDGEEGDGLTVEMDTSMGLIVYRLEGEKTPVTTANHLAYIDQGFFDGSDGLGATVFHRVLVDFVVQGGIFTESGATKDTLAPIVLESNVGLSNVRGTIAMARTTVPDSGTSSFYFNHVDNTFLDYQSASEPGYAVFGVVTEGMDVVDAIAEVAVSSDGVPNEDVVVLSVDRY